MDVGQIGGKNLVYIVELHVKLQPKRINIVEMRAKFVSWVKIRRFGDKLRPCAVDEGSARLRDKPITSIVWAYHQERFVAGTAGNLFLWLLGNSWSTGNESAIKYKVWFRSYNKVSK